MESNLIVCSFNINLDDYALELIESLKEMRKKIRIINDHGSYQ